MEYERFFAELVPRLDSARVLERELDRKLAHRFNVLDYLREDELGLSRIIADLLNPKARHGQGTLFLKTLLSLGGLKNTPHWPNLDRSQIFVDVERVITANRRIDISVHIVDIDEKTYCLAIENKPNPGDQENQVKHYLEYLRKEYDERFLLIYISRTGEGPSEGSIHKTELDQWKDRFAIMPYCGGQEEQADKFKDFRIPHSFVDWLGECRKNCEVDRLRWFLRNAETFCQRTFGGQAMITDSEKNAAIDFVLLSQSNLETALAVHESWAVVKERICKKFLNRLCSRIETAVKENEKLKEFADDMRFGYEYGNKAWKTNVWLYRECWTQYPAGQQFHRRTSISLQNENEGPNNWGIGVYSPMPRPDMAGEYEKRRQRLDTELKSAFDRGGDTDEWPRWKVVELDKNKTNWSSLVPDLHREGQAQTGKIMTYFVDKFIEVAEKAIPIINDIEG